MKSALFSLIVNGPLFAMLIAAGIFKKAFAMKVLVLAALPIAYVIFFSDRDSTGAFFLFRMLIWPATLLVALAGAFTWSKQKMGSLRHG